MRRSWWLLGLGLGAACAQGVVPHERGDANLPLTVDARAETTPLPMPDAMPPPDAQPDTTPACVGGQLDPQTGHCYLFFPSPLNWNAAVMACRALGSTAHLVTLTSAAEHALVAPLVGQTETWIGLSNQANPALFAWVTGEPLNYTNWAAGDPNHGANACARIKPSVGSQWADAACTDLRAYLCERD